MIRIHHVNLQPLVGGGEIYTRALTRALAEAGAEVVLYVHPALKLWDDLAGERVRLERVADEATLLASLPGPRSTVLTQSPLSASAVAQLAARHRLAGFAHMPMFQRSAEGFLPYQLVFTVSRYCIALLRAAGIARLYPEPVYGTAELARGGGAPVVRRSIYLYDERKGRDRLLRGLNALLGRDRPGAPFVRRPGLTLGIVSLLAPIKQLPALFSVVAPRIAQHRAVHLEIFGSGGYAQVRDLRRALAPLGDRARFWGYQENVAAIYPQLDYLMTGLPEKEALGLNAIEAQACGTPVLAPDAPPFTETVVDGASGFRYRDPREDGGADFERLLGEIVAGRPRPDPRAAAAAHLAQFTHAALVERARGMIAALSRLE